MGWLSSIIALWAGCESAGGDPTDEQAKMVRDQIKSRDIRDERVLAAMAKVPRHEFVPNDMKPHAYRDGPLPIGHGQTISQPYIVAFMTEAIDLRPEDRVLEIGTGSGYQAAILAEIAAQVYTVEIIRPLAESSTATLQRLGYQNVKVKAGDGYEGWAEHAPFDAIIVTCAPDNIPPRLVEQLKEGGRMIVPVGPEGGNQELIFLRKFEGKITHEKVMGVRFVPMTGGH